MKRLFFLSLFVICLSCESEEYNYEALNVIEDYDEGLAKAKAENKPIFLYFTGHGCIGDKSYEYEIIKNPKVHKKLRDEFINVWLYVDDRRKVEPHFSPLSGKIIRDIGNKNADLQQVKFREQTQPLFVIIDADGNQISVNTIGYKEVKNGELLSFLESVD